MQDMTGCLWGLEFEIFVKLGPDSLDFAAVRGPTITNRVDSLASRCRVHNLSNDHTNL